MHKINIWMCHIKKCGDIIGSTMMDCLIGGDGPFFYGQVAWVDGRSDGLSCLLKQPSLRCGNVTAPGYGTRPYGN